MGLFCKLLGGVCVMGAAGYFALSLNQTMEKRKQELRKLYSILLQLKSEIQYMYTPLPDSFAKLAKDEPFQSWLVRISQQLSDKKTFSFSDVWQEGLVYLSKISTLEPEDIEPLRELSDKLGAGDIDAQLKAIDYALLHIEGNRMTLEQEMGQKKKVTVTLSLFCGAMTLLLLL